MVDSDGHLQVDCLSCVVTNAGTFAVQAAQSGTWTVDLGATDNAVLDAIAASLAGTLTVGSHAVTNAGTFAVQESGAALTALQLIDDAVYTDATGTPSKGIAVMGTDGTNPQLVSVTTAGHVHIHDGGNSITIDGSVSLTGNLPDTSAGDLAAINAALGGTLTVDASGAAVPITDNGGSLTVDGTVSAAQSGTWNITNVSGTVSLPTGAATAAKQPALGTAGTASTDVITVQGIASMTALVVDGSGVTQPVSASSLPLPTGAATAANQSTIIGHVDGIEGLLTTIDADTGTISTNTTTIAAAVATEGSALGSGVLLQGDDGTDRTNVLVDTDGHLQVDVLSGGGGGTQYAVDAALGSTPTGTLAIGIRDDALSALTPVEGDAVGLRVDANGALWVIPSGTVTVGDGGSTISIDDGSGSITVDNAGTFAVQVDGTALTRLTDIETNTDFGATVGGGTETGALRVTIANNSTGVLSVDDNGGSLTVDGTVTANLSATDNAVLDVIETNTSGNTSHYRNIDANAEASIKGSAGTLKWLHAINLTNAIAYLHLYDATTASVTPGTTTPSYTFPVPTTGTASQGAGFVLPAQIEFSTAITLVCTTTLDGSAGDPGTNGVIVNAGYV